MVYVNAYEEEVSEWRKRSGKGSEKEGDIK